MLHTTAAVHAAEPQTKGGEKNVRLSYIYFPDATVHHFNGKFDYDYYLNPYFSIGAGIGAGVAFSGNENGVHLNVPVTANLALHLPLKKCAPYVALQGGPTAGMTIADGDAFYTFNGYLNPHVGVKIPVGNSTAVDLAVGYVNYGLYNGGSNGIEVKIGMSFGNKNKDEKTRAKTSNAAEKGTKGKTGRSNTDNKFKGGAELEYFTSCEGRWGESMSSMYGVRGFALWSVFTPNLYAGISASVGIANHKIDDEFSNKITKEKTFRFAIMPRLRYDITEATFAKRINPFAQVDVGYAYNGTNSQFAVEPAVGISIKRDNGQSFDFSVGYLPKLFFDAGNKSKSGCFRIAAGYTF